MADIKSHSTLTNNLVSYYDLQEDSGTRYDLHGTYNLSDNNTVGVDASGKIGKCADFIAANSEYLRIAEQAEHAYTGSNNISVSFWFKTNSIAAGTAGIVGLYNAGSESGENWLIYRNGSSLVLLVRNLGAAITYSTALSTGVWYHVVATMSSSNSYQLVVNDGTPQTNSGGTGATTGSLNFQLGCFGNTATGFFDGRIEEVGFWSKVLTAQEITDLYNGGSALPYYEPTDIKDDATLSTSLVSYWKLDETSGSRADAHGTNTLADNNTVLSATGILNNAADFEASNSEYLSITNASQTGLGITGNFSISCWFYLESLPSLGNQFFIAGKKQDGDTGGYYLAIENDGGVYKLQYGFQNDGSPFNSIKRTTYSFSTATWYHVFVTVVVASETYNVYVNGVNQTVTNVSSGITSPSATVADFRIGSYGTSGKYFDGLIDETAIWSKASTIGEARALYGYGAPPEYDVTSASGPANLKSYNTNLKANIKSINTNPIANVKSLNTNV